MLLGEECRRRATASARASLSANAVVVDVVGAGSPKERVSDVCIGAGRRIQFDAGRSSNSGQVDGCVCEVITMRGREDRRCGKRVISSEVRPEKVKRSIVSCYRSSISSLSGFW